MTVALTGSGGLFVRLGHLIGALLDNNSYQGGTATTNVLSGAQLPTRYNQFLTDFTAGTSLAYLLDNAFSSYVQSGQGGIAGPNSYIQSAASSLLITQVNADTPLAQQTVQNAMQVLINQMTGVASVNQSLPTAGAQTAAVGQTPIGNPTILASVIGGTGVKQQYMVPETALFTCTNDVYNGATANQQPFTAVGAAIQGNTLSLLWPDGSGSSIVINCIDSLQNATQGGNILQNSDFDTFSNGSSTNTAPDNWVRVLGSANWGAGGNGNAYASSTNCLALVGDGTINNSITQTFNTTASTSLDAGGTSGTIDEDTAYGVNFYIKMSATPSTGVIKVDLIDGSGNIIADDAGVDNTITKSLTAVSTSYVNVSGVFRTPLNLPTTVKIRIRTSTGIEAAKTLYIDHLALTPMVSFYGGQAPLYGGGPLFAIFSGDTQPRIGDAWTIALGQTFGAFQSGFQRLFGMTQLGLQLPSSGSPSINDNLVA